MKNTDRRPLSQRVSRKEEKIRGQVMKNTNRSTQATQQRVSKQGKTVVLRKSVSSTATQPESEQKNGKSC